MKNEYYMEEWMKTFSQRHAYYNPIIQEIMSEHHTKLDITINVKMMYEGMIDK